MSSGNFHKKQNHKYFLKTSSKFYEDKYKLCLLEYYIESCNSKPFIYGLWKSFEAGSYCKISQGPWCQPAFKYDAETATLTHLGQCILDFNGKWIIWGSCSNAVFELVGLGRARDSAFLTGSVVYIVNSKS